MGPSAFRHDRHPDVVLDLRDEHLATTLRHALLAAGWEASDPGAPGAVSVADHTGAPVDVLLARQDALSCLRAVRAADAGRVRRVLPGWGSIAPAQLVLGKARELLDVDREVLALAREARALAPRTAATLLALAAGASDAEIAARLAVCSATVRRDLKEARELLGVADRAALARHAVECLTEDVLDG